MSLRSPRPIVRCTRIVLFQYALSSHPPTQAVQASLHRLCNCVLPVLPACCCCYPSDTFKVWTWAWRWQDIQIWVCTGKTLSPSVGRKDIGRVVENLFILCWPVYHKLDRDYVSSGILLSVRENPIPQIFHTWLGWCAEESDWCLGLLMQHHQLHNQKARVSVSLVCI